MPSRLPTPCRAPGCPNPSTRNGYCDAHQHLRPKPPSEERRGSARERGYSTAWDRARAAWLKTHPLCAECLRMDPPRLTPATVVDHIVPHRGDKALFWQRDNWQSLCTAHHAAKTARGE